MNDRIDADRAAKERAWGEPGESAAVNGPHWHDDEPGCYCDDELRWPTASGGATTP